MKGEKKSGTKWKPSEKVSMTTVHHTAKFPDDLMTQEPFSGLSWKLPINFTFLRAKRK